MDAQSSCILSFQCWQPRNRLAQFSCCQTQSSDEGNYRTSFSLRAHLWWRRCGQATEVPYKMEVTAAATLIGGRRLVLELTGLLCRLARCLAVTLVCLVGRLEAESQGDGCSCGACPWGQFVSSKPRNYAATLATSPGQTRYLHQAPKSREFSPICSLFKTLTAGRFYSHIWIFNQHAFIQIVLLFHCVTKKSMTGWHACLCECLEF
jgi:hypothetical protein